MKILRREIEDKFGDVLKKARLGLGLTAEEVAEQVGVEPFLVREMEIYRYKPNKDFTFKIADALNLDRNALWESAEQSWYPKTSHMKGSGTYERYIEADVYVRILTFQCVFDHGYILVDWDTNDAVIIDPGQEGWLIEERIRESNWNPRGILVTHGHWDHTSGLKALYNLLQVPVVAHPMELGERLNDIEEITCDTTIKLGSLKIDVMHVPGHTDGHLAFKVKDVVAVGDLIFAGSTGRSLGGPKNYNILLKSTEKIMKLPEDTIILPGHGTVTSVGEELIHNPFLAHRG